MHLDVGGVFGSGIGNSSQKLFYLPEAHTDFIFSVIGEELGFVGTLILIFLFSILIWRGFVIAYHAKDSFGVYVSDWFDAFNWHSSIHEYGSDCRFASNKGINTSFCQHGGVIPSGSNAFNRGVIEYLRKTDPKLTCGL